MDELKECPFCGGSVQLVTRLNSDDRVIESKIWCKPCGYNVGLKKFNQRTTVMQTGGESTELLARAASHLNYYTTLQGLTMPGVKEKSTGEVLLDDILAYLAKLKPMGGQTE